LGFIDRWMIEAIINAIDDCKIRLQLNMPRLEMIHYIDWMNKAVKTLATKCHEYTIKDIKQGKAGLELSFKEIPFFKTIGAHDLYELSKRFKVHDYILLNGYANILVKWDENSNRPVGMKVPRKTGYDSKAGGKRTKLRSKK